MSVNGVAQIFDASDPLVIQLFEGNDSLNVVGTDSALTNPTLPAEVAERLAATETDAALAGLDSETPVTVPLPRVSSLDVSRRMETRRGESLWFKRIP